MKYFGFEELRRKTGFADGTICSRLYNKRRAARYGVETINGHRVVSEENFNRYDWKAKHKKGRGIIELSICCNAPVMDRLFQDSVVVSICSKCNRLCNKYEPKENIKS
jgi:hypothetical protein